MKELNLSIYTNQGGESKVTMTASFESHQDAVSFHEGIANLCKAHSAPYPANRAKAGLLTWVSKGP